MKDSEAIKELEFLFEKIMNCHTLSDLNYLKEYAADRQLFIAKNEKLSDGGALYNMTTRIETGPSLLGWGKGKDE